MYYSYGLSINLSLRASLLSKAHPLLEEVRILPSQCTESHRNAEVSRIILHNKFCLKTHLFWAGFCSFSSEYPKIEGVNAMRALQHGSKQGHLQQPNTGFSFSSLQDPPRGGDCASYGLKCLQFIDVAYKAGSMSQGQVFKMSKGVHREGIC